SGARISSPTNTNALHGTSHSLRPRQGRPGQIANGEPRTSTASLREDVSPGTGAGHQNGAQCEPSPDATFCGALACCANDLSQTDVWGSPALAKHLGSLKDSGCWPPGEAAFSPETRLQKKCATFPTG